MSKFSGNQIAVCESYLSDENDENQASWQYLLVF